MSPRVCTRILASRLESGSSMQNTWGWRTIARPMATRCRWPPESSFGLRSRRLVSPSISATARDPLLALGAGHLGQLEREAEVVADRLVRVERIALEDHRDVAVLRGTRVTSRSPMRIRPSSTGSRPASIRSVVVLPQPDGPTRTRNSPSATSRSIPGTAGRSEPSYQRCARSNVMLVIGRQPICKYAELTNMSWRSPTDRPPRGRTKLHRADSRRHHRSMLLQQLFGARPGQPRRPGPFQRADPGHGVRAGRRAAGRGPRRRARHAESESRVGKPPTMVGLVPDAKHILAIDLSVDDQIVGAVVNLAGAVITRHAEPLEGRRGDEAVEAVRAFAADLITGATSPLLGVGVASPGVVARRASSSMRRTWAGATSSSRTRSAPRSDSRSTSPTTPTSPCWASSPSAGVPRAA